MNTPFPPPDTVVFYAERPNPQLKLIWAAATDRGLWTLSYGMDETEFLRSIQSRGSTHIKHDEQRLSSFLDQIEQYLAGQRRRFDLSIDWHGMTDFQTAVRRAVIDVPYGQTASYGDIAAAVGNPRAARAVGGVQATNPISFVIPCHRIIGSDGSLHGYGGFGGLETKAWLLDLEAQNR